jgi:hypothetical protein
MIKKLHVLLVSLVLSQASLGNGSNTASEGSLVGSVGSTMVVAGGASAIAEVIDASGHMVVASVETSGDLVVLTLNTMIDGVQGSAQVIIEASSMAVTSSALVAGSIVEVTSIMAVGGSLIIGHLLVHAGEVLLFIPQHALALGLHSHKL